MNKTIVFKILYYVCFVFSVLVWFSTLNLKNVFGIGIETLINVVLGILNLILVIIFSIKLIKKKLNNANIMFPIAHLIFSIIVILIACIINNKLMFPYIHFGYYISFILFNYTLLNIYCVLSFSKNN